MAVSNVGKNVVPVGGANEVTEAGKKTEIKKQTNQYGKTVGQPQLSEKAEKYYDELKRKYGNLDFILVSKDQKENAKAHAAQYANPAKMVVLIDEEKIERMATDEKFRKQYEGILSNAGNKLGEMKNQLSGTGAKIKGFGMQVNDDGSTSFFAVLKKSSDAQKSRIEKKQAEKKAEKKAQAKKEEKLAKEKRLEGRDKKSNQAEEKSEKLQEDDEKDEIVISAGSMEELLQKIGDHVQNEKVNSVQTEGEKMVGQHIDFRG